MTKSHHPEALGYVLGCSGLSLVPCPERCLAGTHGILPRGEHTGQKAAGRPLLCVASTWGLGLESGIQTHVSFAVGIMIQNISFSN